MKSKGNQKSIMTSQEEFYPGQAFILSAQSHRNSFAAAFEDDGEAGYFYGMDISLHKQPIVDALLIYNVHNVINGNILSLAEIIWSSDGLKVALFINNFPHAVFDFAIKRGYCRTGFPYPTNEFSKAGHEWSDEAMKHFM